MYPGVNLISQSFTFTPSGGNPIDNQVSFVAAMNDKSSGTG
jgi:hypothetical protein